VEWTFECASLASTRRSTSSGGNPYTAASHDSICNGVDEGCEGGLAKDVGACP